MSLLLVALGCLVVSAFAALLAWRSARTATALGLTGMLAGASLGLITAFHVLLKGKSAEIVIPLDTPLPSLNSLHLAVDPLSAFFLVPVLLLAALAAVYGAQYLQSFAAPDSSGRPRRALGPAWFFYNLTVAAMVLLLLARNGLVFLMAWEIMTIASFFLVTFEHEKEEVRQAGWTYLIASHLGAAFLLPLFLLLGHYAGSLDFDAFLALNGEVPGASLLFVLAIVGFGTKAGFMPLHVWLPEAHPAAPSHVSALMSGVIIKTGIYGILRTLTFLGPPPAWWGWVLVAIGISSGILGVLFALAQHDLKRLLAYHSIENIGIIALGLGIGVLGLSAHAPAVAILGFGGGLLHVLNHALFKGLLFLGAGAVVHGTGTREIDHLGGLLKRMPATAVTFLIGSIAISGLPPLNGFVSEFLIFLGAFNGVLTNGNGAAMAGWSLALIAALGLIGGLAAACFCKAFGIVFLGEPRSDHARHAHGPGWPMRWAMILLAGCCLSIGLLAPMVLRLLRPVVRQMTHLAPDALNNAALGLSSVVLASLAFLLVLALLVVVRHALLSRWKIEETGTWDCGYAQPTARMQYTASSFAQPLTSLFRTFLRTHRDHAPAKTLFPSEMALATHTPDVVRESFFAPLFRGTGAALSKLRGLQQGRVQVYVLYIVLTLLVLLVWKLG